MVWTQLGARSWGAAPERAWGLEGPGSGRGTQGGFQVSRVRTLCKSRAPPACPWAPPPPLQGFSERSPPEWNRNRGMNGNLRKLFGWACSVRNSTARDEPDAAHADPRLSSEGSWRKPRFWEVECVARDTQRIGGIWVFQTRLPPPWSCPAGFWQL